VHSLFLTIEGFRKRLRSLEEIEGATKCAHFLKQLQVDKAKQHGDIAPAAQVEKVDRTVSI
jgi:hypothetical protein